MASYESWHAVLRAVPTRPLLPNLRVLIWPNIAHTDCSIFFIESLLCPTLVEVRSPTGCLNPDLASQMASMLVKNCPNIHTLDLYTEVDSPFSILPKSNHPLDLSSLVELHHLRHLGSGPEVLSPNVFGIIAGLPVLKSLNIHVPWDRTIPIFFQSIIPPPNSFPALQHLGIESEYMVEPIQSILRVWEVQQLVQQLVSVFIKIDPAFTSVTNDEICHLICSICQHSPRITDLYLNCNLTTWYSDTIVLSPVAVTHLKQLPLQRLHMIGICLEPAFDCQSLIPALADMEYLNIEDHVFRYEDLVMVANYMRKLRFLAVDLDLQNWRTENPHVPGAASSLPLYLESGFRFQNCGWASTDKNNQRKHAESIAV